MSVIFTACNPVSNDDNIDRTTVRDFLLDHILHINTFYDALVNILRVGDQAFVPRAKKTFYKFWWTEELDLLKQDSMDSNKLSKEEDNHDPSLFLQGGNHPDYCIVKTVMKKRLKPTLTLMICTNH